MADLAVVESDGKSTNRVHIHSLRDGRWLPQRTGDLPPDTVFVGVAKIADRDRLVTCSQGQLRWFDPASSTTRPLIEISTSYRTPREPVIPYVDLSRDLNHDGRDDLVLPDFDGFWVSNQTTAGSFTRPVKLGPPEPFSDKVALGSGRSYREIGVTASTFPAFLSRIHCADINQDGRSDLAFWNGGHLDVHLQDAKGGFNQACDHTLAVPTPLDSDGIYSVVFGHGGKNPLSLICGLGKRNRRSILRALSDIDGDNVPDLLLQTLEGRSFLRQRSTYRLHLGHIRNGTVQFDHKADTTIEPRGKAGGLQPFGYSSQWMEDFDGDGQVDVLFKDVRVNLLGVIHTLAGNTVPMNLDLYRFDGNRYPAKPTTTHRLRRFSPGDGLGKIFFPPTLVGDMDGDTHPDLLVGHGPRGLRLYTGGPPPEVLSPNPQKIAVSLPYNEQHIWLADLNKDGKQDIVIVQPLRQAGSTRPGSGKTGWHQTRVTTLVSR